MLMDEQGGYASDPRQAATYRHFAGFAAPWSAGRDAPGPPAIRRRLRTRKFDK
jgi:hypothetical protein